MLAAEAPSLREALDKAVDQGLPYLILDGTLLSSDRCADKKTSKKGREIDKWYSGKAHEPAGNVHALAAPGGVPLWVSDVPSGSTHDLTAARELVLPEARPYLKDLPFLADSVAWSEDAQEVVTNSEYQVERPGHQHQPPGAAAVAGQRRDRARGERAGRLYQSVSLKRGACGRQDAYFG